MRMTEVEYQAYTNQNQKPPKKRDKFGRSPSEERTCDGQVFDSLKEMWDYWYLKMREKAGEVRNLRTQVSYPLIVNGRDLGTYEADFVFEEKFGKEWREVVVDSKPDKTKMTKKERASYEQRPDVRLSKLKRGLVEALYGIEIKEM